MTWKEFKDHVDTLVRDDVEIAKIHIGAEWHFIVDDIVVETNDRGAVEII